MTRVGFCSMLAAMSASFAAIGSLQASTNPPADISEAYRLIRSHLPGVTDAELNQAALEGISAALAPRVTLVTNTAPPPAQTPAPGLVKARVFDSTVAYLRIASVTASLPSEISGALRRLAPTNDLVGIVLDLRYADGDDFAAAVETADLFTGKSGPVLNWGAGMASTHTKTNWIVLPVAVLLNRNTSRAAEALAATLRETGSGLLLGSRTAGRAMMTQDFKLAGGQVLRIAVSSVLLGSGAPVGSGGITPDISVAVAPEDERAYYSDAFTALTRTNLAGGVAIAQDSTNPAARRGRMNEAELVREHREGSDRNPDSETATARLPEPTRPMISDPVLARALDLLKGLAVVRQEPR